MQVEVLFYPMRKITKAWDMAELNSKATCPMFGPHEWRAMDPLHFFLKN
jgi:hypothetical protein